MLSELLPNLNNISIAIVAVAKVIDMTSYIEQAVYPERMDIMNPGIIVMS